MVTSLKTDFAQIFSRCTKNLSCPKFGGAAAPLAPPGPYAYAFITVVFSFVLNHFIQILFLKGASEIPSFDNDKRC